MDVREGERVRIEGVDRGLTMLALASPCGACVGVAGARCRVRRRFRRWQAMACSADEGERAEAEAALRAALPADRGIFGMSSGARAEVDGRVRALEALSPTGPEPLAGGAEVLRERVEGTWRVLYTTVSIQGKRRTQLGLRVFVELGEFLQVIDAGAGAVRNVITFDALGKIRGALTVNASFTVASGSRVDVQFTGSEIEPQGLRDIFQENYDLLLAIFDPSGWLETTYLDPNGLRVGRDDKGNVFVLERVLPDASS